MTGGKHVLSALTDRVAVADSDMLFELYQLADQPMFDALSTASRAGRRIDVLGDARLPGGGMQAQLDAQVTASGGTLHTFAAPHSDFFQHGKTYHFSAPSGPESWLTNLAPIADTANRSEVALRLGGDAASSARLVTAAAHRQDLHGGGLAIDAAAGAGVLVNDPTLGRRVLTRGIYDVLGGPAGRDLLVITKGIEDTAATDAIIAAHRSGRSVQVLVRDIAAVDGERLAEARVPTWIVSGGLKPRVNAVFAGDRGVLGSAFLWSNMVGGADVATSRDVGILLDGAVGASVRGASLASAGAAAKYTPIHEAVRAGALPEHI
jgi:hypothetical protein